MGEAILPALIAIAITAIGVVGGCFCAIISASRNV